MGVIEKLLAEFELKNGQRCTIEHNADNSVHIHIGGLRIDMSVDEFNQFANVVAESKENFVEIKNLSPEYE